MSLLVGSMQRPCRILCIGIKTAGRSLEGLMENKVLDFGRRDGFFPSLSKSKRFEKNVKLLSRVKQEPQGAFVGRSRKPDWLLILLLLDGERGRKIAACR